MNEVQKFLKRIKMGEHLMVYRLKPMKSVLMSIEWSNAYKFMNCLNVSRSIKAKYIVGTDGL